MRAVARIRAAREGWGSPVKVGIIIGRIGDVDGVALETEKWIDVLERLGHTCFVLSGRSTSSRRARSHSPVRTT